MRAEELYQLTLKLLICKIEQYKLYIIPKFVRQIKQKLAKFNQNTRITFHRYIDYYNKRSGLKELFGQSHLMRMF